MRHQVLSEYNLICYGEKSECKIVEQGESTKLFLSTLAGRDRMTALIIPIAASATLATQRAINSTRDH